MNSGSPVRRSTKSCRSPRTEAAAFPLRARWLGAFGATVPESYGGGNWPAPGTARLSYELARGWQSPAGLVDTHLKLCRLVERHGTAEQRNARLAPMARGEKVFARA
ncbi:acyl-CoA dehydrogenase family protein [Streptomyces syringium]|uniref:acyl-CoA dehydrogenase family protein n=1 Tax=Streptomyces syringium TaxID=76729 RepID=UPI0033AD069F